MTRRRLPGHGKQPWDGYAASLKQQAAQSRLPGVLMADHDFAENLIHAGDHVSEYFENYSHVNRCWCQHCLDSFSLTMSSVTFSESDCREATGEERL